MCGRNHDASSCSTSIFGCHWVASCDGYCSGSSMCNGKGQSDCSNSIFGCSWNCQSNPNTPGVCVGGSMCGGNHDASSCSTSIFGCHWVSQCDGYCSGSSMCTGKGQSDCSNSIFGCTWTCNLVTCVAEGHVCGGPGQQTQECCGQSVCQQLLGGSEMTCEAPASFNGVHSGWTDTLLINANHGFQRSSNGDGGSWSLNGVILTLDWDLWSTEQIETSDGGNTFSNNNGFTLTASSLPAWWLVQFQATSCVSEGDVCGGPGQQTQTCCGQSQCRHLYGGSDMKCVALTLRGGRPR